MPDEFFTAVNEQRSNRSLLMADAALQRSRSSLDCQEKSPSLAQPCADLGITREPLANHAQYLDHWLGVMKEGHLCRRPESSEAAAFFVTLQA